MIIRYDYLARVLCGFNALGHILMSLICCCKGWSFNSQFHFCAAQTSFFDVQRNTAVEFRSRKSSLVLCSLERQHRCFDFRCVFPALSLDGTWKMIAWDFGWRQKYCFISTLFCKSSPLERSAVWFSWSWFLMVVFWPEGLRSKDDVISISWWSEYEVVGDFTNELNWIDCHFYRVVIWSAARTHSHTMCSPNKIALCLSSHTCVLF